MLIGNKISGNIFEQLYDQWVTFDDFRKIPASKAELCDKGMSDADYDNYIKLIKKLYGALFAETTTDSTLTEQNILDPAWNDLIYFCTQKQLIREPFSPLSEKTPSEITSFEFLLTSAECPDMVHVVSFDDFRYCVERILAGKDSEWYLEARYGATTCYSEWYPELSHYDPALPTGFISFTKQEISSLLHSIDQDISALAQRISNHISHAPKSTPNTSAFLLHENNEKLNWLLKLHELKLEANMLERCRNIVILARDNATPSSAESTQPLSSLDTSDSTLYIHNGKILCETMNHSVIPVIGIFTSLSGQQIEFNVNYCTECKKFFLSHALFKRYQEKYHTILGNFRYISNGSFTLSSFLMAEESPLHLCGYSVNQKDNLSDATRHTIIASVIETGCMSKHEIINLLNHFIDLNGAKKQNATARSKWLQDLEFTLAYNTPRQHQFHIHQIKHYQQNRFYAIGKSPSLNPSPSPLNTAFSGIFKGIRYINMSDITLGQNIFEKPDPQKVSKLISYYQKYNELDKPIVVSFNGSNYTLEDKYLRYYVAQQLGLSKIPARIGKTHEKTIEDQLRKSGQKIIHKFSGPGEVVTSSLTKLTIRYLSGKTAQYDIDVLLDGNIISLKNDL